MKTLWGKPVHVIPFIRTLLIVLAVTVCTVAAEDLEALRKAAEAGDAAAQCNLGLRYAIGEGVAEDEAEAVKWYRKVTWGRTKLLTKFSPIRIHWIEND